MLRPAHGNQTVINYGIRITVTTAGGIKWLPNSEKDTSAPSAALKLSARKPEQAKWNVAAKK
jgi:hypothetical protein